MDKAEKILIVEDEFIVAMEIEIELKSKGFDIVGIAHNSDKAIEFVKSKSPDLVLMDVNIKGSKDGIQTAKEIKEISEAKIIFVSAYSDDETKNRMSVLGSYHFLPKPYTHFELLSIIKTALSN